MPQAPAAHPRLSARRGTALPPPRGVEISAATAAELSGDADDAYGWRVFLRHYCVHLAGPDPAAGFPAFPADARAARGLNGDIAWYHRRWRRALESGTPPAGLLGVRAARKTLLAVAGLVSVHDRTWTTDRARAARRWGEIEPGLAAPLQKLLSWATAQRRPAPGEVRLALAADGIVAAVTDRFAGLIGLWRDEPPGATAYRGGDRHDGRARYAVLASGEKPHAR